MDGISFDPSDIGVVGLCVLAVVAFIRGWVIPGPWHRERVAGLAAERDEWRSIALRSLRVSERTTDASEVAAQALASLPDAIERQD